MKTIPPLYLICVVWAQVGAPLALSAQESRAEAIAAQQAEKAKDLEPYAPGRVEKVIEDFRRRAVEEPNGFYPYFGSVYGGGFMLGAGYRHLYGEGAQWFVRGLYSIRQYKLLEVGTTSRGHLDGRLAVTANVGWRDATHLPFFGLGMNTDLSGRTNTRLTQASAGAGAQFNPVPVVALTGHIGMEDFSQLAPLGRYPGVDALYSPVTTPGLDAEPMYLYTNGGAAIDWRTSPSYSRRGGYYGVSFHNYADVDDAYTFKRAELTLVQHVPILRETWALSLRGRVQSTIGDTDVVPFFLLPALGSGDTLRAYHSWRYRDRHSLLTTAEWRWFPNKNGFDMALFYDAGKVANRRGDLDFKGLKSDWGVGARFHGPRVTALRIEAARGSEGWNAVFAGDAAF